MNTYNHLDDLLGLPHSNIPIMPLEDLLVEYADPWKRTADPWNKGKNDVYSHFTLEAMSEAKKGNTIRRGAKMSDESKKKMSDAKKRNPVKPWLGKRLSEETKKKMSEAAKGRKISEETRLKMSKALRGRTSPMKGKNHSEETKKKIRETVNLSIRRQCDGLQ